MASFYSLFALLFTVICATRGSCAYGYMANEEVPYIRNYFYVGGKYVSDGSGGHAFQDQMCWSDRNKLSEQARWRRLVSNSAELIQQRFTAPQDYKFWPQAVNHTQWPGTGRMGDPVFDAFYSSNVQFSNNDTYSQATVQAAGAALLDRIGSPVIIIGHSQAGPMAILVADARPNLTEAIILLEPGGPPFRGAVFNNASARPWGLADVPLVYSPPVTDPVIDLVKEVVPASSENLDGCVLQASSPAPRRLSNLAPKPILVVTSEASYHAVYDYCTVC
ncbi:alpha/beta-hydrolase, partial [Aureobasidium melanogenum]